MRQLQNGRVAIATKLVFWDKNSALDRQFKHLGLDKPAPPKPEESVSELSNEQKIEKLLGLLRLALARKQIEEAEAITNPPVAIEALETSGTTEESRGVLKPSGQPD